jgi:hypothetical protein
MGNASSALLRVRKYELSMFSDPARMSYSLVPAQKYGAFHQLSSGIMMGSHMDRCGAVSRK